MPKETRSVPFMLVGTGGVGSALLEAIVASRDLHAQRYGIRLCAISVCDSSASVGAPAAAADALDAGVLTRLAETPTARDAFSAPRLAFIAASAPRASGT